MADAGVLDWLFRVAGIALLIPGPADDALVWTLVGGYLAYTAYDNIARLQEPALVTVPTSGVESYIGFLPQEISTPIDDVLVAVMPFTPFSLYVSGYEGEDYSKFKAVPLSLPAIDTSYIKNLGYISLLAQKVNVAEISNPAITYIAVETSALSTNSVMVMSESAVGTGSACMPSTCNNLWPSQTNNPSGAAMAFAKLAIDAAAIFLATQIEFKFFKEGEVFQNW